MTERWRVTGTALPDVGDVDWLVADGRLAAPGTADRDAAPLPGRFVVPGLVDAHCHLTLVPGDHGPEPAPAGHADTVLAELARAGVLAVRDTGAHDDSAIRLAAAPDGAVHVVACGRFLAPPDNYFPGVFDGVPADALVAAALGELDKGATWVKLVADFPPGAVWGADTTPNYDLGTVAALVEAVHARGARVAAHVTLPIAGDLVRLGVDSVEHGTALDEPAVVAMAERGTAWTPTLQAVVGALPPDAPPEWARRRDERVARMRELLPLAVRLGVPVLAGSDVVGTVAGEVAALAAHGLDPQAALAAATTTARAFLGLGPLAPGAAADLVTYDVDPRSDPGVLARPAAVLRGGRRLR